jgi:hypothetical protein
VPGKGRKTVIPYAYIFSLILHLPNKPVSWMIRIAKSKDFRSPTAPVLINSDTVIPLMVHNA